MKIGENFNIQKEVVLDDSHCWLITIGNNVTLAPRVHVLCHDASTKFFLNYTKIGPVTIGNNVFVGASTTILPSVMIGDNVIIASNSVVTKDIPTNSMVAGVPAKIIGRVSDYIEEQKKSLKTSPCFDSTYTLTGGVNNERKKEMLTKLLQEKNRKGFII